MNKLIAQRNLKSRCKILLILLVFGMILNSSIIINYVIGEDIFNEDSKS